MTIENMDRRSYCFGLISTNLIGLSGCLNSASGETGSGQDGFIRPEDEPDFIPTDFNCTHEGFEPHWSGYNEESLHWGDVGDYSMRINALKYEYGETAEIELNAGERGSDEKWHFEILTEDGWQKVRGTIDEKDQQYLGYDDIGIQSDAEWSIELTEEGIISAGGHEDILKICSDLISARYRFVYWGITTGENTDGAIAVAFDLEV